MDHRRMLAWTERCTDSLTDDFEAFKRKQPYNLVYDDQIVPSSIPHTIEQQVLVRVSIADFLRPIPDLEFRVGDIIHNMKVSLDYVAFGVASMNVPDLLDKKNIDLLRQVSFPVVFRDTGWDTAVKSMRMREWADDETIKAFKSVQPFQRPHLANHDPLLLVHKLDKPHKHQSLIAAAPAVTAIDFTKDDPYGHLEIMAMGVEGPFVDRAVIMRCRRIIGPHYIYGAQGDQRIHLYPQVGFDIAFHENGPAAGLTVSDVLRDAAHLIRHVIFPKMEDHF